jgi:Tfp pilus assembly protein PilN
MIDRVEINLLPAEYRVHRKGIRVPSEIVWGSLLMLIVIVCLFAWKVGLDTEINQKNQEILSIDDLIHKNSYIKTQINRLRADRAVIQEKIVALERINVNREKWVRLMEIICQRLPDFTWVVSMEERNQTPPLLVIEGRTLSFPEVANFMSRLTESEYIKSVDLSSIEEIKETIKMFKFGLTCTINPDAQIAQADKPGSLQDSVMVPIVKPAAPAVPSR